MQALANFAALEDQLLELWTTFRAERLMLYREIGVLPYADWKAFYADLTARRAVAKVQPLEQQQEAARPIPVAPPPPPH